MESTRHWQFWADTGGTFTDCLARDPDGAWHRTKVLSSGAIRAHVAAVLAPCVVHLRGLPVARDGFYAAFRIAPAAGGPEAMITAWDSATQAAILDRPLGCGAGDIVDLSTGEEAPALAMRMLTGTRPGSALPPVELRLATTRGTNPCSKARRRSLSLLPRDSVTSAHRGPAPAACLLRVESHAVAWPEWRCEDGSRPMAANSRHLISNGVARRRGAGG
jgi:5-oxoprolinase (ATP-hydrolysing)